jgi:iron complex transport system substrate-binding protein
MLLLFVFTSSFAARVISLAPNLTEMLFAVGAGPQVVGVSSYSNYPKAATKLPVISNGNQLNIEAIVALQPTLVLAWHGAGQQAQLQELKRLHIPVVKIKTNTLQEIFSAIEQAGRLTGNTAKANSLVKKLKTKYHSLKTRYSAKDKIRVFYQIQQAPLITLNHKTIESQLIRACGGQNIFAKTLSMAPQVNLAAVLAKQPQAIIISRPSSSAKQQRSIWRNYPNLPAVKAGNVFVIDSSLIDRPGPRIIQGMAQLCRDLTTARTNLTKVERKKL